MKACFLALAILCVLLPPATRACEVALVLAIDVSGSVDSDEYDLQMNGLAEALGDTTVRDALITAKAKVSVIQWSGSSRQSVSAAWAAITSDAEIDRLRDVVVKTPRAYRHFSTAIGDALASSAALLGEISGQCERQVIDVSGDGISNEGIELTGMRDALVRGGITINGLAIETEQENLTAYYTDNLIGGPGAFVITAQGFEDYPRAIRRKLLRELTDPVVRAPRRKIQDPPFKTGTQSPISKASLRGLWR